MEGCSPFHLQSMCWRELGMKGCGRCPPRKAKGASIMFCPKHTCLLTPCSVYQFGNLDLNDYFFPHSFHEYKSWNLPTRSYNVFIFGQSGIIHISNIRGESKGKQCSDVVLLIPFKWLRICQLHSNKVPKTYKINKNQEKNIRTVCSNYYST